MINHSGSVRVDLVGGTLDLWPINLSLKNVVTINFATSLKANVKIQKTEGETIEINSLDYDSKLSFSIHDLTEENFESDFFGPFRFVAEIISSFDLDSGLYIELTSGSPAGAGLGGSSSMGVTLFTALSKLMGEDYAPSEIVSQVAKREARILNCGPIGYQDYFPALYGGVLALHPDGFLPKVEQLYSREVASFLEDHLTLVFSGETRLSGITNWEVYKGFFDGNDSIKKGLLGIAENAHEAYQNLKNNKLSEFLENIKRDGSIRTELFPNFTTPKMKELAEHLSSDPLFKGLKVCGAGGGGCFLILHEPGLRDKISNIISHSFESKMKILDFNINLPH